MGGACGAQSARLRPATSRPGVAVLASVWSARRVDAVGVFVVVGPGSPPAPTARQRRSSLAHTRGRVKYPGCRIACRCTRGSVGLPPLRGLPRLKRCGAPSQPEPEPASCQGHLHRTARGRRSAAPGSSPSGPLPWGLACPRRRPRAPRANELAAPMSGLRARLRLRGMAPVRNVRSRCGGSFHHARPSGQAGGAR